LFISSLVVHHIDPTIPHYHAKEATLAVKKAYPDIYLYESTPVFQALWRLATKCYEVEPITLDNKRTDTTIGNEEAMQTTLQSDKTIDAKQSKLMYAYIDSN
jgi:hypothetical protein